MSFKEFIIANDRADLIDTFKEWPTDREIPKLYTALMEELLYQPKKGLKLSRKNIAENFCEATATFNIPLYLEWNIDSYIKA